MERGNKLVIKEDSLKAMISNALDAFPEECCGFFYSGAVHSEEGVCCVLDVVNVSETKRGQFRISASSYSFAEKYGDKNNLVLQGVYHSHPDHPARPSRTDEEFAFGDFKYVIVSVGAGTVNETRCWQLDENMHFRELEIEIKKQ